MTKEEAKALLPIIQAYAEGKTVQQKRQVGYEDEWFDVNLPLWNESPFNYRIKPEVKYRPFKTQKECWNEMFKHQPFGWLKNKESESVALIGNIYTDKEVFVVWTTNECRSYSVSETFDNYVFADGTPFGIKEN